MQPVIQGRVPPLHSSKDLCNVSPMLEQRKGWQELDGWKIVSTLSVDGRGKHAAKKLESRCLYRPSPSA